MRWVALYGLTSNRERWFHGTFSAFVGFDEIFLAWMPWIFDRFAWYGLWGLWRFDGIFRWSSVWRNFFVWTDVQFHGIFLQNRGSFQWRGSKRRLTLIWRNSFGVRRFDEIFFFVWLTFGYEVTTRLWSWLDRRSMFQARDHESVTLTGFQRRFDGIFLFSFYVRWFGVIFRPAWDHDSIRFDGAPTTSAMIWRNFFLNSWQ